MTHTDIPSIGVAPDLMVYLQFHLPEDGIDREDLHIQNHLTFLENVVQDIVNCLRRQPIPPRPSLSDIQQAPRATSPSPKKQLICDLIQWLVDPHGPCSIPTYRGVVRMMTQKYNHHWRQLPATHQEEVTAAFEHVLEAIRSLQPFPHEPMMMHLDEYHTGLPNQAREKGGE